MSETPADHYQQAVRCRRGDDAFQFASVHETHGGETVWNGTVAVSNLARHPKADRAYAWSYELENGNRRFFAVLKVPPITSPVDAVRAAIVAEARAGK